MKQPSIIRASSSYTPRAVNRSVLANGYLILLTLLLGGCGSSDDSGGGGLQPGAGDSDLRNWLYCTGFRYPGNLRIGEFGKLEPDNDGPAP